MPAAAGGAAVLEPQCPVETPQRGPDTGRPQRHSVQTDLAPRKPGSYLAWRAGLGVGKGVVVWQACLPWEMTCVSPPPRWLT